MSRERRKWRCRVSTASSPGSLREPFSLRISAATAQNHDTPVQLIVNTARFLAYRGDPKPFLGGKSCAFSSEWYHFYDFWRLWMNPGIAKLTRYRWDEASSSPAPLSPLYFDTPSDAVLSFDLSDGGGGEGSKCLLVRPEEILAAEGEMTFAGGWGGSIFPYYRDNELWKVTGNGIVYVAGGCETAGSSLAGCRIDLHGPRRAAQSESPAQNLYVSLKHVASVEHLGSSPVQSAPSFPHQIDARFVRVSGPARIGLR